MTDLVHVSSGDPHVPAHNEERDAINALQNTIVTKIALPASPVLGALMRWDGDNWVASKMRLFEGNGSPEGVVSAPVGSRYVDATAAGGNAEYFKATGAGNTGWQALNSGLGWTNVALGSGMVHGTSPGQYSSMNGVTYFRGSVRRTSGTGLLVGTIDAGYAPTATLQTSVRVGNTEGVLASISAAGAINVSSAVVSNQDIYLGSIAGTPFRR